jgi:deazaflavin-dependent oxidoreductase (nitroreductase family)
MTIRFLRRIFRYMNSIFMVPIFRLGLGAFVGNPITGYIMVMRTTGWKTGKQRYAPANYAIVDGDVYCMAGFGKGTHWYRNLQAQPNIEVILPGGALAGVAEDASDSEDAKRVIRQILKNSGIVGIFAGLNPFSLSDTELHEKTKNYPLVRIRPTGIGNGVGDAGGWLWISGLVVTVLILWFVLR